MIGFCIKLYRNPENRNNGNNGNNDNNESKCLNEEYIIESSENYKYCCGSGNSNKPGRKSICNRAGSILRNKKNNGNNANNGNRANNNRANNCNCRSQS